MLSFEDVIEIIDSLQAEELRTWIDFGWVLPVRHQESYRFTEIDVARVRLISEMVHECQIEVDAMPVVLGLLDQVYELRRQLNTLVRAIEAQPSDIREKIGRTVSETTGQSRKQPD